MKCKHGYTNCSECGEQLETEQFFKEFDNSIKFNRICSEIMGYRPAWKYHTHYYITPDDTEVLLSEWQPYANVNDLVQVVDYIMDKNTTGNLDVLVANIIDTTVTEAFHTFIEQYHKENYKSC